MNRALFGAFLSVVCLFLYLPTGLAQQAGGPSIVIEEKFFDAREVKEGEVIEHTFTVENKGNEILEIRKVNPG